MVEIPQQELISVSDLKVDQQNPNRMTDRQRKSLAESITRYGFIVPIITNKDLLIADGEQRWEVAKGLGMTQVPVIRLLVEDVDRRLLRQVLNKLRGEHELLLDAQEFDRIISMGHEDDLKQLLDLSDTSIKNYLLKIENPNLAAIMTNHQLQLSLLPFRPITPVGENIYYVSEHLEAHEKRRDAVSIYGEDDPFQTLKSKSWFFWKKDKREFSLREYARVQDFPDNFKFVGTYDSIKTQIGNAVDVKMAEYVAKTISQTRAVSLFSGAGGMDLGFINAGHDVVLSTDWDVYCAYTHRANFPNIPFVLKDIKNVTQEDIIEVTKEDIQLVFGGPPCQGFSTSGLRFKDDPRNSLYREFLRIVSLLKAKYFVMENVMGILSFKNQIKEDMINEGYIVKTTILKGEEIGIRQKRHRVFFIGKRCS